MDQPSEFARPRPRFSLKSLFWLVACIACFFAGEERQRRQRRWDEHWFAGAGANKATVIDPPVINVPFNQKMTALGGIDEFTTYALGKRYTSKITEADLVLCPKWNQDAEGPPISARKALGLATKMKDSLVKDGQRYNWLLASLELKPTRLGQWVWVARYRPIFWFGYVATDQNQLAIVVMMDGTVIKPKVSDWTVPNDREPREGE
jgi:hypothetical protein